MKLFSDGNLTALGGALVAIVGAIFVIGSAAYASNKWLFILGVFVGVLIISIASASLKALVLGVKPFTSDPLGWRKAKESYKAGHTDSTVNKDSVT